MNHRVLATCLGLFAATVAGSGASAEPVSFNDVTVSRTVSLAGLDLATANGARIAARRIWNAADAVCGGDLDINRQSADFIPCRKAAVDRALSELNAPLVAAALGRQTITGLAQR